MAAVALGTVLVLTTVIFCIILLILTLVGLYQNRKGIKGKKVSITITCYNYRTCMYGCVFYLYTVHVMTLHIPSAEKLSTLRAKEDISMKTIEQK